MGYAGVWDRLKKNEKDTGRPWFWMVKPWKLPHSSVKLQFLLQVPGLRQRATGSGKCARPNYPNSPGGMMWSPWCTSTVNDLRVNLFLWEKTWQEKVSPWFLPDANLLGSSQTRESNQLLWITPSVRRSFSWNLQPRQNKRAGCTSQRHLEATRMPCGNMADSRARPPLIFFHLSICLCVDVPIYAPVYVSLYLCMYGCVDGINVSMRIYLLT